MANSQDVVVRFRGDDQLSPAINKVNKQLGGLSGTAATTAFAFNQITQAVGAIQGAAKSAYDLLIGQNVELQQQLLGTQATLAATNKVFQNGLEIKDPTKAIQALEGPVNDAVGKIRQGALELVGVTSKDIIPLFQIVAGQAAAVGANLNQAADLSLSFGAALQTLGVPLFQARQEINSILTGTIDQNSVLAKSLGINNEQVRKWKEQGTLVQELNKKLEAFRAGNALAAQTLTGVSSNILEVVQEITRIAGEPLLEPLVKNLTELYNWLLDNKQAIQDFANEGIAQFLAFANSVGESASRIGAALLPALQKLGPAAGDSINLILEGFQSLLAATATLTEAFGPVAAKVAEIANGIVDILRTAQTAVGFISGGFNDSTTAIETFGQITDQVLGQAISAEEKYKAAIEARNAAKAAGRPLTEDEKKQQQETANAIDQAIEATKNQIAVLNQYVPIGEENRRNVDQQKASLQARLAALQKDSAALRDNADGLKLVSTVGKDAGAAIKAIGDAYEQQTNKAITAETKGQTAITNALAAGTKTKAQAESEKLKLTQDRINAELAAEKDRLKKLQNSDALDPEAKAKQVSESQKKIAGLEKQGAENRLAIEQDALNKLIAANEDAEKKIAAVQEQRITAVKQKQLQALRTPGVDQAAVERQTQAEILKIQQDSITQQIAAKKKASEELKAAEAAGTVPKDEAIKKQAELQSEIAKLNQQRIDNEIAALKAKQEEEIRQIEQVSAAKKRQSELAISGLDAELQASKRATTEQIRAIDLQIAANQRLAQNIDNQNKLLESRANLQRATANLGAVRAANELSALQQALEARKELDSGNVKNANLRLALEQAIARATGASGASQLQIQQAIAQKENELAALKRQQLLADQANARAQLALANQRLQLDQQRAELDARRQVNLAQQQVLEAQITLEKAKQTAQAREQEALDALAIARKKGDQQGVADAQNRLAISQTQGQQEVANAEQSLTLAQDGLTLAQQNLTAVQQQATAVKEIADNSQKALEAQQKAEIATFNATENARQLAQAIGLARAEAEQYERAMNNAGGGAPGGIPGRRTGGSIIPGQPYWVGEAGPEIIVPGASGYVIAARQAAAMMQPARVSVSPDTALLREMRELRKDLKNQRPISNPSYTLINESNPIDKMLRIQMGLMRARY